MPNPVYTHISNMICKHILLITFLDEPAVIFSAQLNGFRYFYLILIILFTINHLLAHSYIVPIIAMYLTIQLNISYLFILS